MKKLINKHWTAIILITVFLIAVSVTYATTTVSQRQAGSTRRLRSLLQEMRDEFNGDTITFDNGATFDNATNNIIEWNENSEGLLWTFASNLVTMSSDTSAVFSFGTLIPNLDGLDVDSYVYYNPISTAPAATEGFMYYDSDTDAMTFRNASAWVSLSAGTGDNTLNAAYDQGSAGGGRAIDVADGAIQMTNDDADATSILEISHTGAAAGDGITVTVSGGSSDGIEIENTGTGADIEGTGNLWSAAKDGDITCVDLTVNGAVTLPNNTLLRAVVDINAAEMSDLEGSPFEILASPAGTDLTYEFVSAVLALDYLSTAWTEPSAPDDLVFRYTDGSGSIVSETIDATGFATATADSVLMVSPIVGVTATFTEAGSTDQSIVLDNTGTDWTNSGNSDVRVIIYYRLHTTAELGL